MWTGCRLRRMFHQRLLSPGGYGDLELIRSTCVLCTGVRGVFICTTRAREVLSSPRRRAKERGEKSGEKEGGDRWRSIRGGESYKKRREEGECEGWGGEFGWDVQSVWEELELSGEGCEKALPVGSHPSGRNVG